MNRGERLTGQRLVTEIVLETMLPDVIDAVSPCHPVKMYPAADAFLIGETLVRSNDPGAALRGFINAR